MKVGIMTMQRIHNYGSFLQAYGLKKLIEEQGHEVVFVDYRFEPAVQDRGTWKASVVYRWMENIRHKMGVCKKQLLEKYGKKRLSDLTRFELDFETKYLRELGVPAKKNYRAGVDILVIGSDEVFNCTQGNAVGYSRELFGKGNRAGKVISYAASFGNTTVEKLEKSGIKEEVSELLTYFSALSVRDRNSCEAVRELTGKEVPVLLDPVLIYGFCREREVKAASVPQKDYILVYGYNQRITEAEGELIREFAGKKGKKLIAMGGNQSFCDEYAYCSPLEIFQYFMNADSVITDTFHGTIFSVLTHSRFATIVREDAEAGGYGNQEKLGDLLQRLQVEQQKISDLSQLEEILTQPVDFELTEEILREERKKARNFLKEELK